MIAHGVSLSKTFADYATRKPTFEYPPFIAHDENGFRRQEQNCVHIKDVVWDTGLKEWVSLGKKNKPHPRQSRPREWPKSWQWPFDVMHNRENIDGSCINCGRGAKEPCSCKPSQWRVKSDWEPLRALIGTQDAGIGVKTLTAWKKDDILGDYVGEIRPFNDTEDNQYSMLVPLRRQGNSPTVAMIDATKAGNWTRFVNHTTDDPNLEIDIARVGQQRLMVLKARREINWGEELRFNYGTDWRFPNPEPMSVSEDETDSAMARDHDFPNKPDAAVSRARNVRIDRRVVESITATTSKPSTRHPKRNSTLSTDPNLGGSGTAKKVRVERPAGTPGHPTQYNLGKKRSHVVNAPEMRLEEQM